MASILKGPRQLSIQMLFSRLYLNLPNSSTRSSINGIRCCSHRLSSNDNHEVTESPENQNRLIYEGPLMSKVKSIKLLSLSTSISGLLAQTYIYSKSLQEGSNISTLTLIISSTMVLAFSLTPLLLNSITKRYVYQLYFNSSDKSFTAFTLNFLNQPVKTHFTKSTFELAPVASPFTTILVNKKPLFVDLKEIKDPEALELFV